MTHLDPLATGLLFVSAPQCKEWDREAKLQLDFLFFVSMTPLSQYIGTDEMGAWTQLKIVETR